MIVHRESTGITGINPNLAGSQVAFLNEPAFTKLFFQNLSSLESILSTRSEVIQCMLELYAAEYDDETERSYLLNDYFKNYASIPCTPDGKVLRKCTEVVDRDADFAPCMISLIAIFLVTNYQKGIFLG